MEDVLSFRHEAAQGNFCANCEHVFDATVKVCPNDGTVFAEIRLIEQQLFGRYQILSKVGTGGSGTIYKAKQQPLGRIVAIKMLKTHSESQVARFRQEAQVSSLLDHPNIIHLYDFGATQNHQPFMVMDFVEGDDLGELIKREGIPNVQDSLRIFGQICEGMQHAHSKGIIHRDLKPSNIMLTDLDGSHPRVRIVDFGIAKALSPGPEVQNLTSTAELFGSPYYMSPEQALGRQLDPRSDIYALGCVMYETMTFTLPIAASTAFNTLRLHVTEKPMSISERCPHRYSHELEHIVMKCLAKDPAKRFHSMAELKHALDNVPEVLNDSRKIRLSITMPARPVPVTPLAEGAPVVELQAPAKRNILSFSKKRKEMLKLIVLTSCVITMVGGVSAFCLNQFGSTKQTKTNEGLDSAITSLKNYAQKPLTNKQDVPNQKDADRKARSAENAAALSNEELVITTSTTDTFGRDSHQFRIDRRAGAAFDQELKRNLKNQPNASLIIMTNCHFSENSLACLKGQKQIVTLNMVRCTFPEKALSVILDMPQLQGLILVDGHLTDNSMKYLANLKHLRMLDLTRQPDLTEKALENLPTSLEDLHIKHDRSLSKETLGNLARYKKLQSLNLIGTRISDAGLAALKCLPALQNIDLSSTAITDDGVDALVAMPKLRVIELTDSKISRDGLLKLAHAPYLKELVIYESESLTDKDFEDFRKISKDIKLTPDKPNRHHDDFINPKNVE
jgi:serine/threonine protein kinase